MDVLLCIVHLPSKLCWSGESQALECTHLARIIREVEARVRHERTVLVGDLNMNPFEAGVVGAAGFNATMARQVASRGSRSVQGERYPFFYNPMWGHFGDHRGNAGGSYYYDSGQHVNYYWNVFDQVLVRPELIPRFPVEELRIIASTPSRTLLSQQGRPDARVASDHLPLLSKRTNHKLRGAVETTNYRRRLVHTFCIVAPSLDDYRYELFMVSHGVMPYPVEVMIAPKDVKIPPPRS